ncbi:MAG TPA: hypothetical protein VFX49_02225, partial [Chloroflexota bacterium]|nr:hypothetical protein [Chloroflexota bacterium]
MRRSRALLLLAAYLICRAALGAALNPLDNGPDEAAHVEYVRAIAHDPTARATGVESRQLPTYYLLAAIPWRLTDGASEPTRIFAVRLLSALCGAATLALIWLAALVLWPGRMAPAATAAGMALAPGHLFLLGSVSNDPLATTLASGSFLAALQLWVGGPGPARSRWSAAWMLMSAGALLVKPTALPVVAGAAAGLVYRFRRPVWAHWSARLVLLAAAVAAVAGNVYLAAQEPTSGALPALARFWPMAVLRAPVAYIGNGGLAESFRTWWYGYDYLVRWPVMVEALLAVSAGLLTVAVTAGLALRGLPRAGWGSGGLAVPGIVWWCAASQVAFLLARYGLGDVLRIEMGGAAQAKAFFAGIAPLALLWSAGLVAAGAQLRLPEREVARGALAWL